MENTGQLLFKKIKEIHFTKSFQDQFESMDPRMKK